MSTKHRNAPQRSRAGHTLIELVIAMTSATMLMVGLGASVGITVRAFRPETGADHARTSAAFVEHDLLADLRLATGFTERTDKAVTFTVPDRDGDGRPEKLRYAWTGVSGAPFTFSYNGTSAIPLVGNVQGLTLTYLTNSITGTTLPAEQTGSQILLLVNDSSSPTAAEASRKSLIESWNFVVVMMGLNDGYDTIMKAADQSKAIYISGTINAAKFEWAEKLAETTVGIVNEHPDLVSVFGFAASSGATSGTQITVVNNSHYITTGQSTGNVSIASWPVSLALMKDTPSKNLNSLATVSDIAALATIDTEKSLYDGRTATGRRVFVPWGNAASDPKYLNANGQLLTCKAIEWATGLGNDSPEFRNFGYETVFSSNNSAKDYQLSTKAALSDKGMVVSVSAYVGGVNDQVRFAIYSDKNGQPDALLVQSAIGTTGNSMGWVTLPVPPTQLNAGNYWLAFSFKNGNQKYAYAKSYANAGERNKSYAAVSNGFLNSWGSSNTSYNGARSIFATYEVLK